MASDKYASAHEWFEEWLHRTGRDEGAEGLEQIARLVASKLDVNDLKDLFQEARAADGYFDDLDLVECDECGDRLPAAEITEIAGDGADLIKRCPECAALFD